MSCDTSILASTIDQYMDYLDGQRILSCANALSTSAQKRKRITDIHLYTDICAYAVGRVRYGNIVSMWKEHAKLKYCWCYLALVQTTTTNTLHKPEWPHQAISQI